MNYDDMTDEQINFAIAEALGYEYEIRQVHCNTGVDSSKHYWKDVIYKKLTENKKYWLEMDYCNDWGAMGPVIQEYGIEFSWPDELLEIDGIASAPNMNGNYLFMTNFKTKGQALRAAAICFLKMKESEK